MSLRHSWPVAITRTVLLGILFMLGCVSTVFTQYVGLKIFKNSPHHKQAVINTTKTHFVTLIAFITHCICPVKISITYDPDSLPSLNSFRADSLGNLISSLSPNSVAIGNHQIYTDWLFVWFLFHTARLGNCVYIVLKDLSKIPVLGYGMKNFNFMFLSRKWDHDKVVLTNQLLSIDANARGVGPANGVSHVASTNVADSEVVQWPEGSRPSQVWPYEVVIYPEGTVMSPHTRERSNKFCDKLGLPRLKHTLIPRTRGLFLTLHKLRGSLEVVYDFTTGYSDLLPEEYGEDKYTLKGFYILGYGPRKINYHVRAFKLSEIPLGKETVDVDDVSEEDMQKFDKWLYDIWYEKDLLMESFYKFGTFVDPATANDSVSASKNHTVEAEFKLRNPWEITYPYLFAFSCFLVLRLLWIVVSKLYTNFAT